MKKEDIVPGDWYRILFGETPAEFLLEVLMRTLLMYVFLLVIVRMMGKRMVGQLTISELAVMITLGAIVSPGMQMPQTGLLLCIMILVCALIFQRSINWLEYKSEKFEKASQGELSIMVTGGVMQLGAMAEAKISRQQLFASLRNSNIYNLGEIDRVYLEACGVFSIYKRSNPEPGLLLFPQDDPSINKFFQNISDGMLVCVHCGKAVPESRHTDSCPVCQSRSWAQASLSSASKTITEEK
jgi:uncharacterized membrane protein YcaP (DUF421 family)